METWGFLMLQLLVCHLVIVANFNRDGNFRIYSNSLRKVLYEKFQFLGVRSGSGSDFMWPNLKSTQNAQIFHENF